MRLFTRFETRLKEKLKGWEVTGTIVMAFAVALIARRIALVALVVSLVALGLVLCLWLKGGPG